MSANPWMPLYVADYVSDTMHLSTLEHGAYFLLILAYWQRQEPLPDDPDKLAKICRMTRRQWQDVASTISEFFEVTDGKWVHHRIEREISTARAKYEKRAAAGKKGGLAKSTVKTETNEEHSSSIAKAMTEQIVRDDIPGLYQPQPQPHSSLRSDAGADAADAQAQSLAVVEGFVREEHVDIACQISEMVQKRWPHWLPPADKFRIKSWLEGGWSRETIEAAVSAKIQRMETEPRSYKFFEQSIADLAASLAAPLPTRGTDRVQSPSARETGHSNLTAALARRAAKGGG